MCSWIALNKVAYAIRSIYLISHQIPLNARILLLKLLVLSYLLFSAIFQNLSAENLRRLNRWINWGIKVCFLRKKVGHSERLLIHTEILPAELIAGMSLVKFHYDVARPENSENFYYYLSLHQTIEQNNSKLDRMSKPTLELIRLFVNAKKNGVSYHNGFGWQKLKAFSTKR